MTSKDPELLPIGDLEYLQHISSVSSPDAVRELVKSAPSAVEKELKDIRAAIANNDPEKLKEACHALKGACYSVQVRRLAHYTKKMEEQSANIDCAKELLPPLEEVGRETIAWWHSVLEKDLYRA